MMPGLCLSICCVIVLLFGNLVSAQNAPQTPGKPAPTPYYYPPFLANVSAQERARYSQIQGDRTMTKKEIKEALEKWAADNGISQQYAEFEEKERQKVLEFYTIVTTNLSAEGLARKVLDQFWTIYEDMSITRMEECQRKAVAALSASRLVPTPPYSLTMFSSMSGCSGPPPPPTSSSTVRPSAAPMPPPKDAPPPSPNGGVGAVSAAQAPPAMAPPPIAMPDQVVAAVPQAGQLRMMDQGGGELPQQQEGQQQEVGAVQPPVD